MPGLTVVREFLVDLQRQKLRTSLTIMGITWGTVAVVVLLAFGTGLAKQMKRNARGIGEYVVILTPGVTTLPYQGFTEGRQIRLDEGDVAALRSEVPGILRVSPEYGDWTPVRRGRQVANPFVSGVYPEYAGMRNVFAAPGGRFFNQRDMERRRRVAFIGDELANLLFAGADPIGETIYIRDTPFIVVGVMQPKTQNSSYQSQDKDRLFIPSTTYTSMFGDRYVSRILYQPADPTQAGEVRAAATQVLANRHSYDPADRDAVYVWDTAENMKMFNYLFLGFNLFLGVVGSFTLIVGGVGVANIMYIVVRERTREIGIKRALGARRSDILGQIFLETTMIVAIGATIGLIISIAMVKVAGLLPIQEEVGTPEMSPMVVGVTLTLLAIVAFFSGLFPARRAANLDPVESLRYGT
ncbi:MAG TPA: ABC transporter permease [Longimicrobiaceae bacterium]